MWLAVALAVLPAQAQRLDFDVASIKRSDPGGGSGISGGPRGGPGSNDPGRVVYTNVTLTFLLGSAYDIRRMQLAGVEKWMDTDLFDVEAKVPQGAGKDDLRIMTQNLLLDRFGMKVHRETKEMPIYALVVAKGGSKLKPAQEKSPTTEKDGSVRMGGIGEGCPAIRVGAGVAPNLSKGYMVFVNGRACMVSFSQSTKWLADSLAPRLGRPVVDSTGLTGEYAFQLLFDPGGTSMPGPMAPPPPGAQPRGPAPDGDSLPDLFTAIQQQLGLKLESRRGPVETLVIDHAEKTPKEN